MPRLDTLIFCRLWAGNIRVYILVYFNGCDQELDYQIELYNDLNDHMSSARVFIFLLASFVGKRKRFTILFNGKIKII